MDWAAAVDRLYGGALADFVATRKELAAQARSGGDRVLATRITALRKPSLAAWAINAAVRSDPPELARLEELAASLRDAQSRLDGAAMRSLTRDREPLLDELAAVVAEVAAGEEVTLTAAVAEQVRASFVAAIADPRAQEAVFSGNLTRALAYAGLGEVDLTQATATPVPPARGNDDEPTDDEPTGDEPTGDEPTGDEPTGDEATGDEATVSDAGATMDGESESESDTPADRARVARIRLVQRAQDRLAEAERDVTAASLVHADAQREASRTADRLGELQRLLDRAAGEAEQARAAQDATERALADARLACEEAREELDALGP